MKEQTSPRGRLVIVDDERAILDLLVSLFEDARDVRGFERGQEALAHVREHGVDVLLTDKNLPDLGGLELLDHVRQLQPDAEVLLITGYASIDTAVTAMQRGAFDYIVKPPKSIFDVRRKVDQAFARQAMVRENQRLVVDLQQKNAELEAALDENQRVQAELVQSEKLAGIGTLAAGIAHEISSPLFGVMGLAEAISEEDDLDAARRYAAEIVTYARSIKEIVVQLSGYSRTAEREYLADVDLDAVIHDAVRLVVRSLGLDEELVAVRAAPGVRVRGRSSELQQVLVNLVKNAVEAVEEAGRRQAGAVEVRARTDGAQALVTVHDEGPGIAEDALREIFDPFFTTKPPGRGTGLGLNIVYRLVTKYGGTVQVASTVGEGTTFTLRLPLARASSDEAVDLPDAPSLPDGP